MDKFVPRVIVKFRDDDDLQTRDEKITKALADLELTEDKEDFIRTLQIAADTFSVDIAGFADAAHWIDVDRIAGSSCISAEKVRSLLLQVRDSQFRPRNLLRYFAITYDPARQDAIAFGDAITKELRTWPIVELAYLEGAPAVPPTSLVNEMGLSAFARAQHYLDDPDGVDINHLPDPAHAGIAARFAWTKPGGTGSGVRLLDIERGWFFAPGASPGNRPTVHEDLPANQIQWISGENDSSMASHGNKVLGVVLADPNNARGGEGVASDADAGLVAAFQFENPEATRPFYNIPCAILSAINNRGPNDVLLLEAQWSWDAVLGLSEQELGSSTVGLDLLPVEADSVALETIRLATALGLVVIEAAGDGGRDLDEVSQLIATRENRMVMSRNRDSGAVMVGATQASAPYPLTGHSNFGCRVDCYCWGESVYTSSTVHGGPDHDEFEDNFVETSAAAAIIAGGAVSLQGIASARQSGNPMSPTELRALLSSPTENTSVQVQPCEHSDLVPVMPNLRHILEAKGWA